jgi:RNA-directed DNA polymerase
MKTPHRRTAALPTKGVPRRTAQATAGNVRGPWRLARGKALSIGLSIAYFTSIGLPKWDDGR